MKLRNAHLAIVDRRKVADYLLNAAHPDNSGKAAFFTGLGYSLVTVEPLMQALRAVAATNEVVNHLDSVYGEKHVVDGLLPLHTGQGPGRMIRTVWFIDRGQDTPRLVTAYPSKG